MFCPNCGATVPDGYTMCPQCGRRINAPQAPSSTGIPAAPFSAAQTDGKATASLVLGILSVVCLGFLTGIPAIILGHMSRSSIRKSRGRLQGNGMALAGLVMGYICVVFNFFIIAIAIPNLIRARISVNESAAARTVSIVTTAEFHYHENYPKMGYAPDLATLGGTACSTGDVTAEHACLITGPLAEPNCSGGQWCSKGSYQFMIQADEHKPHRQYVITAVPTEPNKTGTKAFCSTNDGIVRSETTSLTTPYTAEECVALNPLSGR